MREFSDEMKKRDLQIGDGQGIYVPFSFEKMVSFLSYRSQRHNLFVKFLSTEDWNTKLKESMR